MNGLHPVLGIAAGFFLSFFVLFVVVPALLAAALACYLGIVEFLERRNKYRQHLTAEMYGPPPNRNQTT